MGLLRWMVRMLSRGAEPARAADDRVELTVLKLPQASLAAAYLQQQSIDARCTEAFNVATSSLTDGRITVPRQDLAAAREALDAI